MTGGRAAAVPPGLVSALLAAQAFEEQGNLAEAERLCRDILIQHPDQRDALRLHCVIALRTGRAPLALDLSQRMVDLDPDNAEAWFCRGIALQQLGDMDPAIGCFDQAIALCPDHAEAHSNRGIALYFAGRFEASIASFDAAIALRPEFPEAHNNRGISLQELRRSDAAAASFEQAIRLRPDYAEAHANKAMCLLQTGQFEQGWPLYEWRKRLGPARDYRQPLWLGEHIVAGRTVFLYWEQGFGDTIQFCRYAKLVAACGAAVVMEVQPRLVSLLARSMPDIQVIGSAQQAPPFDYHCPLASLPLVFGTSLEMMPAEPAYIASDPHLREHWSARLPPRRAALRVGLVWSGGRRDRAHDNRRLPLTACLPLLRPDIDWVCLQQEVQPADAALLAAGGIACPGDPQRDFDDAAALIDLMDLVISVDTSVAHLAGAMGKPVWLLLPYCPDWRWLLDRDDSPWYPSARLFRQQSHGNWEGVIARVSAALLQRDQL